MNKQEGWALIRLEGSNVFKWDALCAAPKHCPRRPHAGIPINESDRFKNLVNLQADNHMAAKKSTKPSEPDKVNEYMKKLDHPLSNVVEALRKIILAVDSEIGEEIKWNAPAFFYTGEMEPFDPKEFKRHLIVFNLFKKDCIRLVFWGGAKVKDTSGFLEGDYEDGRRLAMFYNMQDVESKKKLLQKVIKQQLKLLDR